MIVCGIKFFFFGDFGIGWARSNCAFRQASLLSAYHYQVRQERVVGPRRASTRKLFSLHSFGDPRMSDSPAAAPSKRKVLVADDEQVIANTLAIILNQAGFEARAVDSGEKVLESLDAFQPEMLIPHVGMTGMTRSEAPVATRARMPNCKILLFSGQATTADLLKKARQEGHEFE